MKHFEYLPSPVEKQLAQLISLEAAYHKNIEQLKKDLKCGFDFTPQAAFRTLTEGSENFISYACLHKFLSKNGVETNERDLGCLVRRLDLDADNKISLIEF